MVKCTFCGDEVERGTGKTKILKEGKLVHLCSMKCEKNMFKLGRVARETPWTAEYRTVKDMRLLTVANQKKAEKTEKKEVVAKKEVKKSK